jgi:hypothetical protein
LDLRFRKEHLKDLNMRFRVKINILDYTNESLNMVILIITQIFLDFYLVLKSLKHVITVSAHVLFGFD